MKLCALLAGVLLSLPGISDVRPVDDPEPRDCPLCGGDATLHKRVMSRVFLVQASAGLAFLDAAL